MTEPTTPQLTESDVEAIEAANKAYRIDWRYPNQRKRIDALTRDWRALKAERDEAVKARDLYVSLKRGQQERADELYGRGLELLAENTTLREQLADARAEGERLAAQLKEWQEEKDTKAGYL